MTRMPPITSKADLPPDKQHLYDDVFETLGPTIGSFALLLHSPEVAIRMAQLREYCFSESSLTPVERDLAVLLAAREADCEYLWSRVVEWAPEAGTRQEAIDVIGHRLPLDSLTAEEALIVAYGRELLGAHRLVSNATFEAAKARYSNLCLTDLTATLGFYTMLACFLNAFGMESRPGLPRLP